MSVESKFSQDRYTEDWVRRGQIDAWREMQAEMWRVAQDLRAKSYAFGVSYCGVRG